MPELDLDFTQTPRVNSPVRDDAALGPTESLDRNPDGIPHAVIAATAFGALVLAALILVFLSGHVPRHPGAVLLAMLAVPVLIVLATVIRRRWRTAAKAR